MIPAKKGNDPEFKKIAGGSQYLPTESGESLNHVTLELALTSIY